MLFIIFLKISLTSHFLPSSPFLKETIKFINMSHIPSQSDPKLFYTPQPPTQSSRQSGRLGTCNVQMLYGHVCSLIYAPDMPFLLILKLLSSSGISQISLSGNKEICLRPCSYISKSHRSVKQRSIVR